MKNGKWKGKARGVENRESQGVRREGEKTSQMKSGKCKVQSEEEQVQKGTFLKL